MLYMYPSSPVLRDYRYGLMNCTKKVSYKAKDLGPDEDLLRKSAEKVGRVETYIHIRTWPSQ